MVYPQMVTHPSINRVRRRVTTLIETNALPLSQATIIFNLLTLLRDFIIPLLHVDIAKATM